MWSSNRVAVPRTPRLLGFSSVESEFDDVVDVVLWCLDRGPAAGLFNVGTGQATSFRELIEALYAAAGTPPAIRYVPMPEALRPVYQYFTEASVAGLRAAGYARPFTPPADAEAASA